MKKILTIVMVLISMTSAFSQKTYPKKFPSNFTDSDKRFVNSVVRYEKEELCSMIKRKDSYIVLEFPSTMYVLNPSGYVEDVWILEDEDWIKLGKESE